jgi:hypothetical protein
MPKAGHVARGNYAAAELRPHFSLQNMIIIDAPHFYAAVGLDDNDVVVKAAPIVNWAIGKKASVLLAYCQRKGWRAVRQP